MKKWSAAFYIFSIPPAAFLISLLSFCLHVIIRLGKFPIFAQQDPQDLIIYRLYEPTVKLTMSFSILSLLSWITLVIVFISERRESRKWLPVIVTGIVYFFVLMIAVSEVFMWVLD